MTARFPGVGAASFQPQAQETFTKLAEAIFPSPGGRGLKVRDIIQRALRARFKILLCSESPLSLRKTLLSKRKSTRAETARRERCSASYGSSKRNIEMTAAPTLRKQVWSCQARNYIVAP